uniref:Uncharacterized protein n=1 Tax=Arundo donax TaxID=35708 RepID=A0A0A9E4A5_ARUDO
MRHAQLDLQAKAECRMSSRKILLLESRKIFFFSEESKYELFDMTFIKHNFQ